MASTSLQQEQLIVTRPDDWHLHLRDGGVLEAVLPHRIERSSMLTPRSLPT
jgi:dihydroorotase